MQYQAYLEDYLFSTLKNALENTLCKKYGFSIFPNMCKINDTFRRIALTNDIFNQEYLVVWIYPSHGGIFTLEFYKENLSYYELTPLLCKTNVLSLRPSSLGAVIVKNFKEAAQHWKELDNLLLRRKLEKYSAAITRLREKVTFGESLNNFKFLGLLAEHLTYMPGAAGAVKAKEDFELRSG